MKQCIACNRTFPISDFAKSQSRCRSCRKAYMAEWRQRNAELIQQYNKAYKAEHKGCTPTQYITVDAKHCTICGQFKLANQFSRDKYSKDHLAADCKDCNGKRAKVWREAHPDRAKEHIRNWKIRNPDRKRELSQAAIKRRNAARKAAGNAFTRQEWRDLCAKYDHRCLCCGQIGPNIKLTPDHIKPLMDGGSHGIENIQPLCLDCNLRKGRKTIDYRRNYEHAE